MRQTVARQLRKFFVPVFNDSRDRTLHRAIKRAFNKTPRPQRTEFLQNLAWHKIDSLKTRTT